MNQDERRADLTKAARKSGLTKVAAERTAELLLNPDRLRTLVKELLAIRNELADQNIYAPMQMDAKLAQLEELLKQK